MVDYVLAINRHNYQLHHICEMKEEEKKQRYGMDDVIVLHCSNFNGLNCEICSKSK